MKQRSIPGSGLLANLLPKAWLSAWGLLLASTFLGCGGSSYQPAALAQRVGIPVNVLTWHNDNVLSGLNPDEGTLTPTNVNAVDFGQLFSYPVDGYAYAQPLYMSGLEIPGEGLRNVVFVATQHDSLYAFDADGLAPGVLWHRSFINPEAGVTTVPTPDVISRDIVPEVGITGTPVIDGSTGILYVVPKTKEMRSGIAHYVQRLHAIDVATGLDFLAPVEISDTTYVSGVYTNVTALAVCGLGDGSEPSGECEGGRVVKFNAMRQLNRMALKLSGNLVYIGWASHGDNNPYHGWLAAYNKTSLALEALHNNTPNGRRGGIWMSGGGVGIDSDGNVFYASGNGSFAIGPPPAYSDSVVKLPPELGQTAADFFTPYNQASLDAADQDLGSGGVMLLPDQPGPHPHLMVETGKQGRIYLMDREDMGGYQRCGAICDDVVQIVNNGITGVHSSPAFFDNRVYYQASGDVLKAFRLVDGRLQTPPNQSTTRYGFPGATASISALGTSNAIAWTLQTDAYGNRGASILHAHEAVNLPHELYNSRQTGLRDQAGPATKFTIPTVANGKVYVGSGTHLNVFGPFPPNTTPPDAAPSNLSGVSQFYSQATLSWTNHATNATGVKIERSTNGIDFQQVNTVARTATSYTDNGLSGSSVYFYRVRATNQIGDSADSNVVSVRTLVQPPALAADSCVGGLISLRWNDTADGHYEIERSTDGISFATVGSVPAGTTSFPDSGLAFGTYIYRVEAFSSAGDSSLSNVVYETLGPIHIDHDDGFDHNGELQANGSAQFAEGVARLNNADAQSGSVFTTQRVGIRGFRTRFTVRFHEGTDPRGDGIAFVIQGNDPKALATSGGGGLGYGPDRLPETPGPVTGTEKGIRNSVAIKFNEFTNTTGIFTDGRAPTVRNPGLPPEFPDQSMPVTGGVSLQSQSDKEIELTYDGITLTETIEDPSISATFTTTYVVDIASFVGADTAYVGFTGATGASWTLHDVLTWTYDEQESGDLPPRTPARLRVTGVDRNDGDTSKISIGWLCNAYAATTGFAIERSTDGVDFTEIARVAAPTTTFMDPQELGGGSYYYRARAFNDKRESGLSGVDSVLIGGGDHPTVVDHSKGFDSNGDITANGNALYSGANARLTRQPGNGQSGTFFLNNRLPIKNFTTSFTFQITGAGTLADGMTFIIQGNQPTAIGLRGNALGYEDIQNSVAIKFDIFNNEGEGDNSTGIFTDGRRPTVRAVGVPLDVPDMTVTLDGSGINLRSQHVFNADVTYDGAALQVTITDTVSRASATQTYTVDLPKFLGGNFAYLGWGGGTGGLSAVQEVKTWIFQSP